MMHFGKTPDDLQSLVRAEAARRLAATDWMVMRAAEGGKPVPADVLALRAAIRARSNEIEAMTPIPPDFADDKWWPAPAT